LATLEFPSDAYLEYAYFLGEKRLADPLNPRKVDNGTGDKNHYFTMPEYRPNLLARPCRGAMCGKISAESLPGLGLVVGKHRNVIFYQPPVTEPVPLVVVWDGPDYMRRASLTHIVSRLIAQQRIRPIALAMIANGGPARIVEYACGDAALAFVMESVLPAARRHLNLIDPEQSPGAFGVMGASMGGLMALYTGLRLPGIFGQVLSQSGAFSILEGQSVIWPLVKFGPVPALRIWMDAGHFEWLLEPNRKMAAALQDRGYSVEYHEFQAGHNYPAWRDDLWRGLEHLFRVHAPS
jgi:enterochelin esterase family protein